MVAGENFDGVGSFKFSLIGGEVDTNRSAQAEVTGTERRGISEINIIDGGTGYVTPPQIQVVGTGTGAQLTAQIENGSLVGITIDDPGTQYAIVPPPQLIIDPPPPVLASAPFWRHDGIDGLGEPTTFITLPVSKGLYSLLLGDTSIPNMAPIPHSVFANPEVYLRVWFSHNEEEFELLQPDQRIAAVGYAIMASASATSPTISSSPSPIT